MLRKTGIYMPQPGWPVFVLKVAGLGGVHGGRAVHHDGRAAAGGCRPRWQRKVPAVLGLVALGAAAYGALPARLRLPAARLLAPRRRSDGRRARALSPQLHRARRRAHRPRARLPDDRAGRLSRARRRALPRRDRAHGDPPARAPAAGRRRRGARGRAQPVPATRTWASGATPTTTTIRATAT